MAPKSPLFCFSSSSTVCLLLGAPFFSINFLVFRSRLSPSCRHIANMLPASFALNPDSSPALGLEVLHCNIAVIRSTPPPPAAVSSLRRASILAQGMGEGLLSKFSVQASGKWSVHLSRFLIVGNTCMLRGDLGGRQCHGTPRGTWRQKSKEREED